MTTPQEPAGASTPEQHTDWWGDPISEERQVELDALAEEQGRWAEQPEAARGDSPLKGVRLTGAEVFWLAKRALAGPEGDAAALAAAETHLRSRDTGERFAIVLGTLHLEGADLSEAQLEGAILRVAQLEGADLSGARLEGADLGGARLEGAILDRGHLDGAILVLASLERANLRETYLEGAVLHKTHLEGANLIGAHLEGTYLIGAHLEGTFLIGSWLDSKTTVAGAILVEPQDRRPLHVRLLRRPRYGPALGDIHWADFDLVQLTQVDGWDRLYRLTDERWLAWRSQRKLGNRRDAARAYRQVAARLRDQGYSDVADRLTDRAQVLQRKLLFRQMLEDWRYPWRLPGDLGRWLFSWVLAILAGYGYHPGRTLFWYLVTIAGFAFMYMQATHGWIPFGLPEPSKLAPLPWYEALILSVSSFHGRGFFQPLQSLGDPVAALAAIEAVIGLFIEISFIATFTQRYFGNK